MTLVEGIIALILAILAGVIIYIVIVALHFLLDTYGR
jgi:hypothetical protein